MNVLIVFIGIGISECHRAFYNKSFIFFQDPNIPKRKRKMKSKLMDSSEDLARKYCLQCRHYMGGSLPTLYKVRIL